MSQAVTRPVEPVSVPATRGWLRRLAGPLTNPWAKPRFLLAFTWLYILWSLLPVAIAIMFSFNNGRSRTVWQGFSFRWYWGDPVYSVFHSPELTSALWQSLKLSAITMVVAVGLGTLFAIGIDRWRGRGSGTSNFVMLFSFVTPEIIVATALLLMIIHSFAALGLRLGTPGQLVGLIAFEMAYPVIIVRARLLSIGRQYEEAAKDLGASTWNTVRLVLFPLLLPAIFASLILVFADTIDDFVIAQFMSSTAATQTIPMIIYQTARGTTTPATNALATLMLLSTTVVVGVGVFVYRMVTRGERREAGQALGDLAANI